MGYFKVLVVSDRKIRSHILNWEVEVVSNADSAIGKIHKGRFDSLAIASGIPEVESKKLEVVLPWIEPNLTVVHFDEEYDLGPRIKAGLREKRVAKATHEYHDNSFDIELAGHLKQG